jgi:hypothetical protein
MGFLLKKTLKTECYISSSRVLISVDPRLGLNRISPGIDCVNGLVVFLACCDGDTSPAGEALLAIGALQCGFIHCWRKKP